VTDRVHPGVHAVQTASEDAMIQWARCDPERSQLVQGYNTMLASGERGHEPIRWPERRRPSIHWAEFPAHTR
jgi:hypothetical protein